MELSHYLEQLKDKLENPVKEKHLNERQTILKEIYTFYLSDEIHRKKANWSRFCSWCHTNKKGKESLAEFKKSKQFIKPITAKELAIRLAHIKTSDLYYIKSECVSRNRRGEDVGGFILGAIKAR
jgi:hypothetical protein